MSQSQGTTAARDHVRVLLLVIAACIAVFAVDVTYATFTDYPEWMWIFVFVGLVGSVAVGVGAVVLLVGSLLRKKWS